MTKNDYLDDFFMLFIKTTQNLKKLNFENLE